MFQLKVLQGAVSQINATIDMKNITRCYKYKTSKVDMIDETIMIKFGGIF